MVKQRSILLGLLAVLALLPNAPVRADVPNMLVKVVTSCGSETYVASTGTTQTLMVTAPIEMDTTGKLCTNATAGSAATIADGADVTQGATTDAAATAGSTGTVSAKLRFITSILNTISTNMATTATNTAAAIPAGTATIGGVTPVAAATGGGSTIGNIAANNTTAVVVKGSAGTLYGAQLAGIGSAPAYLKIYDATSATCGSGTPVKRLMIPAASTAANGGGSNISFGPVGVNFATGITYCITTGITDADTTAPAASTFLVNLDYK